MYESKLKYVLFYYRLSHFIFDFPTNYCLFSDNVGKATWLYGEKSSSKDIEGEEGARKGNYGVHNQEGHQI